MAAAPRAVLRRSGDRYVVEVYGAGATERRLHYALVAALNADPALRLLWRPVREEDRASDLVGPDALYVVPA